MDSETDTVLREKVVDSIRELLPRVLRREVTDVGEDMALVEDLGVSSTAALELMLELEENLQLEISIEDLEREDFNTVGTLADYVARNILPEE
jgi:acyl carrier protein